MDRFNPVIISALEQRLTVPLMKRIEILEKEVFELKREREREIKSPYINNEYKNIFNIKD